MKKEYEVPQMDIVKFSMDTDVMASVDESNYGDLPGANTL